MLGELLQSGIGPRKLQFLRLLISQKPNNYELYPEKETHLNMILFFRQRKTKQKSLQCLTTSTA